MWLVAGLSYFFTFIFIIILNVFFSKKFIFSYLRFWSNVILRAVFIRTKIIFEEPIDKSKAYIYMPNHVSMLDVLLAAAYLPTDTNAIEAHTHLKWPIYGKIMRIFGQIPINRKNVRASIRSFEVAKERLKNNRSIIVFPEGTRSKDGIMRQFKKLPFKFAKDAGFTVVPVGFIGVEKILPKDSMWLHPAKIKIVYGKQISSNEISKLSVDELSAKVRSEIERILDDYKF